MREASGNILQGRVAIVTGGGGFVGADGIEGTGSAIATTLAAAGAAILVVDRDTAAAAETCRRIEAAGGTAAACIADVSDFGACERAVADAVARFGRLDILVNNAAVTSIVMADAMIEAEWTRVIGVNLSGAMYMSRHALPHMAKQGGAIVNIASSAGMRSFANPAYAASKAGMIGLTVELAGSYGKAGIRTNAIVPGTIVTPMAQSLSNPATDPARRLALTPLGTEGRAGDVAEAVLFLASDAARWINGVTLPVDGGMLVVPPRP